jgi:site-specific DNA-methyltransferase (adenine-specific)
VRQIILGDNLDVLPNLPDGFASLCYIDSPFNVGKKQQRTRIKVQSTDGEGDRTGFGGREYITEKLDSSGIYYDDKFDDFEGFLMPRIEAALHCLTKNGSLFVHLDHRESHYIKVALDKLLGRTRFLNEIVWSFDFGGRSKTRWSQKHNTILVYVLDPKNYIFNYDAIDRIPYMSGAGLVSEEKLKIGKTPTSVWWQTIVPTNSKEKTGYPSQKPLPILNRIVKVHSNPGDCVLDFFAGSGTTGQAAENNERGYVMIDSNPDACAIMKKRLVNAECVGF